jgi:hypothetical protein
MDTIDHSIPCKNPYTQYLYYTSYLIGLSSTISYYHEDYATFIIMFILFLTSINFWYHPSYGIGRDVDLFLSKFIVVYFYGSSIMYYKEYNRDVFITIVYQVAFIYFIENILIYFQNPQWVILHMMIHTQLAFFTPFILYIL